MNKEIKENWIKALKSGEYKQGQLQLKEKVKEKEYFCCLGVLCDILIKEDKNVGYWDELDNFVVKDENEKFIESEYDLLPVEIQKIIKHNSSDFYITEFKIKYPELYQKYELGDSSYGLAELNDCGLTFDEIAYIIEHEIN